MSNCSGAMTSLLFFFVVVFFQNDEFLLKNYCCRPKFRRTDKKLYKVKPVFPPYSCKCVLSKRIPTKVKSSVGTVEKAYWLVITLCNLPAAVFKGSCFSCLIFIAPSSPVNNFT